MFSGIIEDLGTLIGSEPRGNGRTLVVRCGLPIGGGDGAVKLGDSIAVDGACLTVESMRPPDTFTVAAGRETLERTTLGAARPGDRLHLERALRLGDRLDGHLVSGHVDGVGVVRSSRADTESVVVWVEAPPELTRYIAEKGSVCLNGVSLTVNEVEGAALRVNLIPFTADVTRLAALRVGDRVNIEVDLIARYLERLLGARGSAGSSGGLTLDKLAAYGFSTGSGDRS